MNKPLDRYHFFGITDFGLSFTLKHVNFSTKIEGRTPFSKYSTDLYNIHVHVRGGCAVEVVLTGGSIQNFGRERGGADKDTGHYVRNAPPPPLSLFKKLSFRVPLDPPMDYYLVQQGLLFTDWL